MLAWSAAAVAAYIAAVWAVSVPLNDVSIADVAWGCGFVVLSWVAYTGGRGDPARRLLLTVLVRVWGLRLSTHLLVRWWRLGREDFSVPGTSSQIRLRLPGDWPWRWSSCSRAPNCG